MSRYVAVGGVGRWMSVRDALGDEPTSAAAPSTSTTWGASTSVSASWSGARREPSAFARRVLAAVRRIPAGHGRPPTATSPRWPARPAPPGRSARSCASAATPSPPATASSRAGGGLGGYGGNLGLKRARLAAEGLEVTLTRVRRFADVRWRGQPSRATPRRAVPVKEASGVNEADLDMARRCREGDPAAFEALYRAHAGRLFGLVSRMLGSAPEAEDVLQEIFVSAHRKMGGFRGESSLGTWLYRIAVNHCLDHLRSRGARMARATESLDQEEAFEPAAAEPRSRPRSAASIWNGPSHSCRTGAARRSSSTTWRAWTTARWRRRSASPRAPRNRRCTRRGCGCGGC